MEEKGKKSLVTVDELLNEMVEEQLDDICENYDKIGLFLDYSEFPGIEECCEEDALFSAENYLDEEIFQAIQNGEQVEIDEDTYNDIVQDWCDYYLEYHDEDADCIAAYNIKEIETKFGKNKYALVLRQGYSFDNLSTVFEGLFDSIEDAEEYLEESGQIKDC